MATLSSSRIYDLVERFFTPRRSIPHVVFDIVRVEYPAVRRLAENHVPTPEATDNSWIQRVELRGHDAVVGYLVENAANGPNSILVLFVDERCGLIAKKEMRTPVNLEVGGTVASILEQASSYHARGIILASNQKLAHRSGREKLTMELYRKGEAIEVFLLDHFVLENGSWKRMFAVRDAQRL